MLRSPEDLESEDQREVELAGCSGKDGFFYLFLFWATKNQFLGKYLEKVINSICFNTLQSMEKKLFTIKEPVGNFLSRINSELLAASLSLALLLWSILHIIS